MTNPNPQEVLDVLQMSDAEMMAVDIIVLYQAFYALPTHYPLALCDVKTGKGFEKLNQDERIVASRIVKAVQNRCPVPKIERYKKFEVPAANDANHVSPPKLRITHH